MAECLILKAGSKLDDSELSATPRYVRQGKTFYGSGSDDVQTGSMKDIAKITKQMAINETYAISEGYHGGEDTFTQNIPTQAGPVIDPGASGETVSVTGKYLTSNTTIQNIENLRPEVIKKGVKISDITGTFEGFVD